jgi:hypothetical protein
VVVEDEQEAAASFPCWASLEALLQAGPKLFSEKSVTFSLLIAYS